MTNATTAVPPAPPAERPADGAWLEVLPGLRWIRLALPFALDHVNVWLLEDREAGSGRPGWTLIDTGFGDEPTAEAWEALIPEVLEGRPVLRILVTHFHPDHAGQAGPLQQRFAAPLLMSRTEHAVLQWLANTPDEVSAKRTADFYRSHGMAPARLGPVETGGNVYRRRLASVLPHCFQPVIPGDTMRVDGRTWRTLLGRGHSPEHLSLYSPDLGVLIAGDQVLGRITPNVSVGATEPDSDPLSEFLETLGRFAALPEETLVLPSHGRPFVGLRSRIAEMQAHHVQRLDRLLGAADRPVTAAELLPVLFERKLDDHQVRFAMGEAISHLNHLWLAGRLERERLADGVLTFRRPRATAVEDSPALSET